MGFSAGRRVSAVPDGSGLLQETCDCSYAYRRQGYTKIPSGYAEGDVVSIVCVSDNSDSNAGNKVVIADGVPIASNTLAVAEAAVGDVYELTQLTVLLPLTYAVVVTAGKVPSSGSEDDLFLARNLGAADNVYKAADNKITAGAAGDLVLVSRFADTADSTNNGEKVVGTDETLTGITNAIYFVKPLAAKGEYYKF